MINRTIQGVSQPIPEFGCKLAFKEKMIGGLICFLAKATNRNNHRTSLPELLIRGDLVMQQTPDQKRSRGGNSSRPDLLPPMNTITSATNLKICLFKTQAAFVIILPKKLILASGFTKSDLLHVQGYRSKSSRKASWDLPTPIINEIRHCRL